MLFWYLAVKSAIIQTLLIHNALHKRKAFLDSFYEGLDCYGLLPPMKMFPQLFEQLFVSRNIYSEVIINIIIPPLDMNDEKEAIVGALFEYLRVLTTED